MKVYVCEFLPTKKKFKAITFFSGEPYSHTGMIIPKWDQDTLTKKLFFCDLGIRKTPASPKENDYKIEKINTIQDVSGNVDIIEIPKDFTFEECEKMLNIWKRGIAGEFGDYGLQKLLSQWNTKPVTRFSLWYYQKYKKVFKPVNDYQGKTCGIIVDFALEDGGFDSFPTLSYRITVPGFWAKKYKKNIIMKLRSDK